ncbi:MAG TPA: TIGR02300 family protein [Alphaproteobacteria bacterium]|nr:TIGR02300 family protein [Alphaproteobacteria bacterium]
MAKAALGQKRVCLHCGARFYDLNKHPIVCPSCGTTFEPEAFVRTRRTRPAPVEAPKAVARPAPEPEIEADVEVEDVLPAEEEEEAEAEAEEEEVLEDASELGEDEDDMAEVIENVDGKEKEP